MERVEVTITGSDLRRCLQVEERLLQALQHTLEREGRALLEMPIESGTAEADSVFRSLSLGLPMTKKCDVDAKTLQARGGLDVGTAIKYLKALRSVSWTALSSVADDHRFTAMVIDPRG